MNAKPTPGPWRADLNRYDNEWRVYSDGKMCPVINSLFKPESDIGQANARLIAAAVNACFKVNPENPIAVAEALPELVSCCAEALTVLGHLGYGKYQMAGKLRAAIAKLEAK